MIFQIRTQKQQLHILPTCNPSTNCSNDGSAKQSTKWYLWPHTTSTNRPESFRSSKHLEPTTNCSEPRGSSHGIATFARVDDKPCLSCCGRGLSTLPPSGNDHEPRRSICHARSICFKWRCKYPACEPWHPTTQHHRQSYIDGQSTRISVTSWTTRSPTSCTRSVHPGLPNTTNCRILSSSKFSSSSSGCKSDGAGKRFHWL